MSSHTNKSELLSGLCGSGSPLIPLYNNYIIITVTTKCGLCVTPPPSFSAELSLDQRVEYMSRGVMCAKSCRLTTSGDTIGELLHELEEKMEVCLV